MKAIIEKALRSGLRTVKSRAGRIVSRMKSAEIRALAARYGYYGALALLLIILGTASNVYRSRSGSEVTAPEAAAAPVAVSAMVTPAAQETPEPVREEPERFVMPVSGEVYTEFSDTALVWSETLGQWHTHAAVDLIASPGEAVLACADGVIEDMYDDPLWGNVIVIAHDNGMKTVYANLGTLNLVSVGDTVSAGDTVSTAGKSAPIEENMPWHVHIELFDAGGRPVDFMKFAQENSKTAAQNENQGF